MTLKAIIQQVQQEIEQHEKKIQALKKSLALLQEADTQDGDLVLPTRAPRGQRIKQVVEYLSNGARQKNEIASALQIPIGTLDSVLNRKDLFSLSEDGKWSLKK